MSRPLLLAVGAVVLSACYSPTLTDCVVACGLPGDCGDGQICGTDGLCAAPEAAGTCKSGVNPAQPDAPGSTITPDAPPTTIQDAPLMPDAAPMPDASPSVTLRLVIAGRGAVSVPGVGICGSAAEMNADCSWLVLLGSQQQVVVPTDELDKWQTANCIGQGATCTFTASTSPTLVKVKLQQMD